MKKHMNQNRLKMREVLGVDVGNQNAFVSVVVVEKEDPKALIPNELPMGMPTSVYVVPPKGEVIQVYNKRQTNANSVERNILRKPGCGIRALKTRMEEAYIKLDGVEKPVAVDKIYAEIVKAVVTLANEERVFQKKEPLYEIVLTYPAAYRDKPEILNRMKKSVESIMLDGHALKILGILPEPAAVAVDYLNYMQNIAPEEIRLKENQFNVVVYDLGHGTFDTALVTARSKGEPYKVLAYEADLESAGKAFDGILEAEILRQLKEKHDYTPKNERERERIRVSAVETKHKLTDEQDYFPNPQLPDGSYGTEVYISREQFEQLSGHILFETLGKIQNMLERAKELDTKVDAIVLSGGASRMPMVKTALEKLVEGRIPVVLYRPSEAVSFGAARYACGLQANMASGSDKKTPENVASKNPNKVLEQVTEYQYGIWTGSDTYLEGIVSFQLQSGRVLPAATETFELQSRSSRIEIKLYRALDRKYEHDSARMKDCESIQWFQFNVPKNEACQFRFVVEEDKNITVECTLPDGTKLRKSTADRLN